MTRFTLQDFVENTRQQDRGQGLFELESPRMLEVNLDGMVWTKTGSMVAYVGHVKFTPFIKGWARDPQGTTGRPVTFMSCHHLYRIAPSDMATFLWFFL